MALYARPNRPELDASKVPTAIDVAWAAGIYEGEGTCRLCGKTKRGFMASVVQKDPELLYWLRDWFGGSVRGNGSKSGCHTWDICGDRARMFIALIYKFMTTKRKTQIDSTRCLEFLQGRSPTLLSVTQMKSLMDAYYAENIRVNRANGQLRSARHYRELAANSEWMEQTRMRNQKFRDNMTPEQREFSHKYQRDYYQKKKSKQL